MSHDAITLLGSARLGSASKCCRGLGDTPPIVVNTMIVIEFDDSSRHRVGGWVFRRTDKLISSLRHGETVLPVLPCKRMTA